MSNPNIEDYMGNLLVALVVDEAMEYLNDGYPLDDIMCKKLEEVGIDAESLSAIHEHKNNA